MFYALRASTFFTYFLFHCQVCCVYLVSPPGRLFKKRTIVALGFEPRLDEPKSSVLPLHHATIMQEKIKNQIPTVHYCQWIFCF